MKNYKIQIKEIKKKDYNIVLSGKLVLENIIAIKEELLKKMILENKYTFNFEKLNQIDLSFIQMLFVLENDETFTNISINYDEIHKFKDFKRYISYEKL